MDIAREIASFLAKTQQKQINSNFPLEPTNPALRSLTTSSHTLSNQYITQSLYP
jgi:hypothetical protein